MMLCAWAHRKPAGAAGLPKAQGLQVIDVSDRTVGVADLDATGPDPTTTAADRGPRTASPIPVPNASR